MKLPRFVSLAGERPRPGSRAYATAKPPTDVRAVAATALRTVRREQSSVTLRADLVTGSRWVVGSKAQQVIASLSGAAALACAPSLQWTGQTLTITQRDVSLYQR